MNKGLKTSKQSLGHKEGLLGVLSSLGVLYIAVPMAAFFFFVASNWREITFAGVSSAAYVSVGATTLATVLDAVLAIPLAYLVATSSSSFMRLLGNLIRLPLGLPPLVAGVMLLLAFGPYTLVGRAFNGSLVNSFAAVTLAQLFVSLPFVFEIARSAFKADGPLSAAVASTLGFSKTKAFLYFASVENWPQLRSALALGWLRAFGEFGATILVAYHPYSLPIFTYVQFSGFGVPSAVGTVLVTLLFGALGSLFFLSIPSPRALLWRMKREKKRLKDPTPTAPHPISFSIEGSVDGFSLRLSHSGSAALSILGFSGSGKSLAISYLAGASLFKEVSSTSYLQIGESKGTTRAGYLGPYRVSWVPQVSYLSRGYRVYEELELIRRENGVSQDHLFELVDHFGVKDLLYREGRQLSGGQRQLVALVRAFLVYPDLVLMDEPFSALDFALRKRVQRKVALWLQQRSVSSILVTHDPEEAVILCEEILCVSNGEKVSSGGASEVFDEPGRIETAAVVGIDNVFPREYLDTLDFEVTCELAEDTRALGVRAHAIDVRYEKDAGLFQKEMLFVASARVSLCTTLGKRVRVLLSVEGLVDEVVADLESPSRFEVGDKVFFSIKEGVELK